MTEDREGVIALLKELTVLRSQLRGRLQVVTQCLNNTERVVCDLRTTLERLERLNHLGALTSIKREQRARQQSRTVLR